jgi:hypothetical protein
VHLLQICSRTLYHVKKMANCGARL